MASFLPLVAVLISVVVLPGRVASRTWHVKPDNSGDAPTIQAAIDSAQSGDDVLLAAGTYSWTSESAHPFSMLTIAKPGLTFHSEAGAASTILDAEFQWRILRCRDVGGLVIEGLTFQNGASKIEIGGNEGFDTHGGAIYITGGSQPIIRGCVFESNSATGYSGLGGAIYCGAASIEDCHFINNRAGDITTYGEGGALNCGAALVTSCVFRNNTVIGHTGAVAGAVSHDGADLRQCIFESNLAGAAHGGGLAGAVFGRDGSLEMCLFRDNQSGGTGGAVAMLGGAIRDCTFVGNGVRRFNGTGSGGGVYMEDGTISRCVFVGNEARQDPAGPGLGGAIRTSRGGLVENCTLVSNSGGTADGVGGISMDEGLVVREVIVAFTTGRACAGLGTWSCSNLFGNDQGNVICGADAGGNFSADPEFCAADPATSLNFTLQQDSPCAPGNHPDGASCGLIGAAPVGCGTVSSVQRTWTQVKKAYR